MALVADKHQVDKAAVDTMEIFLQSGEFYFGSAPTVISTMLHSRTVITFWHPTSRIGGMCHIEMVDSPQGKCEMHYGDCAITEFAKLANKYHTPTQEFEVRVFAGAGTQTADIVRQEQTLDKVHQLLKQKQFKITEIDADAGCSRKIKLDMSDGHIEKQVVGKTVADKKQVVNKQKANDEFALEVFLHPGDLYFGSAPTIISTLLGSCVSVTLWHPKKKIGGMSHIILPESTSGKCEMRYGDCAVGEFAKQAVRYQTKTNEYEVHIYGGSDMFPDMKKSENLKIGDRNVDKVKELLNLYKFHVAMVDTGGTNSRKIKLDLSDGSVGIRKTSKPVEG